MYKRNKKEFKCTTWKYKCSLQKFMYERDMHVLNRN